MGFDNRKPRGLKPVEKIEVNTEHVTLRYILFAVCCIVAIFAIWFAVSTMLKSETGWQKVTVKSTEEMSISGDLTFYYNIGKSGKAPRTEVRELSSLYTEQAARSWKLVSATEEFEGVGNLATVNAHPNEEVTVEPELYKVLSEMKEADGLWILLWAPCYDLLDSVAAAASDEEAKLIDPVYSEDAKEVFQETYASILSHGEISLELLGDCKVKLSVKETALRTADDTPYLDFGWMRNAVAVEIISDAVIEKGYTYGMLSSYDGFVRNFDESQSEFTMNLYGRTAQSAVVSASYLYSGARSMVEFSAVPILTMDAQRMHAYQNGDVRTTYVGTDGSVSYGMESLLAYSEKKSIVALASKYVGRFMTENISQTELCEVLSDGDGLVWTKGSDVFYTDASAKVENVYENASVKFKLSLVK